MKLARVSRLWLTVVDVPAGSREVGWVVMVVMGVVVGVWGFAPNLAASDALGALLRERADLTRGGFTQAVAGRTTCASPRRVGAPSSPSSPREGTAGRVAAQTLENSKAPVIDPDPDGHCD